jgi:hypothetical protein
MRIWNANYFIALLLLSSMAVMGQRAEPGKNDSIYVSGSLLKKMAKTIDRNNLALARNTDKYYQKLARQEKRLFQLIARTDSTLLTSMPCAAAISNNLYTEKLKRKAAQLAEGKWKGAYLPYLDSLTGALSFLKTQKLAGVVGSEELTGALTNLKAVQGRLQAAAEMQKGLQEQYTSLGNFLKNNQLLQGKILRQWEACQKQWAYQSQYLEAFRAAWKQPDKAEEKLLAVLQDNSYFRDFMSRHAPLAALFHLPAGYANSTALPGNLQTRAQTDQLLQRQLTAAGPNAQDMMRSSLAQGQSQIQGVRSKIKEKLEGKGDISMPDYKVNTQKTRTFLQRLEWGTNFQTSRSNAFYPTTADLGLSVGYKLNNRSIVGIGASYKLGMGKDIRAIQFSGEGMGLRSFIDYQLKGSFYLSGGFEYNYQPLQEFAANPYQIRDWTRSGLLGVSKVVSLQSKFFKKTKLQLLWDFLNLQPDIAGKIKFRFNYSW